MPTLTRYDFTQQVDYSNVLTTSIQQSSISASLAYIETVGSGPTMIVSVWFTDILSDVDISTLSSVMTNYVNNQPTADIIRSKVQAAQSFGQALLLQIEIDNVIAGLSTAQISQMISDYNSLISMLQTGSLVTALAEAQTIQPLDGMTQQRLNGYIAQLKSFLGVS